MKCTELVAQDHVMLRRGLDILDGMIKKLEDGERIEIADVATILKFLRLFGDEYHQTMEEKVLFPVLLHAAPQESVLRQMLLEHGEERALVAGIEDALRSKRGMDFLRTSRRLSMLLRNHLDKEDTVLCDIAERALSKEDDDVVMAEITKTRPQPEAYANLAQLEWKYTPKPKETTLSARRELARGRGAASYR